MMTSLRKIVVLAGVILFFFSISSHAQSIHFRADLSQSWNENFHLFPMDGTGSAATGQSSFDYDTDSNQLSNITLSITGLSVADLVVNPEDRSHIHKANDVLRLVDIGILGFVDVTGGIEITGGSATISEAFEAELLTGTSWINIHTLNRPFGEIAGVITAVPLPPGMWLFGSGLIGLITLARRKPYLQRVDYA